MNPLRPSTLLPALLIFVPPHARASLVLRETQQFPPVLLFAAQVALSISLLPNAVCDSTVISSRVFVTQA
jgi:hypothetical protein